MLVKCNAVTCLHCKNNMCTASAIEMFDFEYYQDIEGKKKDITTDDMKCVSYKNKYDMES